MRMLILNKIGLRSILRLQASWWGQLYSSQLSQIHCTDKGLAMWQTQLYMHKGQYFNTPATRK